MDWCSLRGLCTRFQPICDYLFEQRSESFQLKPDHVYGKRTNQLLSVKDVKPLIRNFGQFIKRVSVRRDFFQKYDNPASLVPLVDRYCLTLKDLELIEFDLDRATIIQCCRLFSNLHRLVIEKWSNEEALASCFELCVSIKELKILQVNKMDGKFLARRIESLESFTMARCYSTFDSDYVQQFFDKNWQLKKVKISHYYRSHIVQLPNLESLSLGCCILSSVIPLPPMSSTLKNLEIDLYSDGKEDTVDKLLADLAVHNSLEYLYLVALPRDDKLVERLCELKTVKILKFSWTGLFGEWCEKLARELPALSEIHFIECEGVTFKEIKKFALHSTNLKKIVYYRRYDTQSPLTNKMLLSLVKARQEAIAKETLSIFLHCKYLVEIRDECKRNGMSEWLIESADVITLLPLTEEQTKTFYQW